MSETRITKGQQSIGDVEVTTAIVVRTPELDRLRAAREQGSESIGAFLDWLSEQGYHICRFDDRDRMFPVTQSIEAWLAEYFEIDMETVEQERCALLDAIRR